LVDLLSLYRDVLMVQLDAGVGLTNEEMSQQIGHAAAAWPPEATLRRMEAIGATRERIEANVAPLLAVEALMVALLPSVDAGAGRRPG